MLIVLLVVVVTILSASANPIDDGDAAAGNEKEHQVVDSIIESRWCNNILNNF